MSRCVWLLFLVALSLAMAAESQAAEPAPRGAGKPNFIFILLDDQGWADAGAFGHPYMKTPAIDRLAQGARFKQFYVNNPVCSPSRCAFMTGNYPARYRIHGHFATHELNANRGMPNWLDPETVTVCDLLKRAGYATGHFGKWHLGMGDGAPPLGDYGIDDWKSLDSNPPGWDMEADPYFRAHSTGLFVDETIRFIKAHKGQPFYVNLWTLVPHALLKPTPEELAVYKDLQVNVDDFPSWMREYLREAKDPVEQMRVFCAAMTGLDQQVGRLMDFLDTEGLADNTVIVLSSDNGPEDYRIVNAANAGVGFPGAMRARKRSLYDGGIRTTCLVRWPGNVKPGRVEADAVLTAVDFLPTVCKLAGAEVPKMPLDGEDVSDILLGASRARTRPIYWEWIEKVRGKEYTPPSLAVRDGRWKLFVNADGSGTQLYDIPNDPEERTNVTEQHPDVAQQLTGMVLAWKKTLPPSKQ